MFCNFQELRTSFQGNHNSQLSTLNSQLKKLSTFNSQFSTKLRSKKKPRKFSLARLFKWRFKMDLNQRPPD